MVGQDLAAARGDLEPAGARPLDQARAIELRGDRLQLRAHVRLRHPVLDLGTVAQRAQVIDAGIHRARPRGRDPQHREHQIRLVQENCLVALHHPLRSERVAGLTGQGG